MNLAYTSATLGLHLDLPFYEYTPGVQVPFLLKIWVRSSVQYLRFFSALSNTRVLVGIIHNPISHALKNVLKISYSSQLLSSNDFQDSFSLVGTMLDYNVF